METLYIKHDIEKDGNPESMKFFYTDIGIARYSQISKTWQDKEMNDVNPTYYFEEIKPTEQPLTPKEQEAFDRLNEVWGDDKDGKYEEWYNSKKQPLPETVDEYENIFNMTEDEIDRELIKFGYDPKEIEKNSTISKLASKIIAKKNEKIVEQTHVLDRLKDEIIDLKQNVSDLELADKINNTEIAKLKSQLNTK